MTSETTVSDGTSRPVRPDIFIAGVMKGGTTILHEYLCKHPNIVTGSQKEIHYFSLYYDRGPGWYAQHFNEVPDGCRTIDASPTYFDVTSTALIPSLLKTATHDPRVIVITRDPVLRAVSQFVHLQTINKRPELQGVSADEFFSSSFDDAFRQSGRFGFALHQALSFSLYWRKYITYRQVFSKYQLLALDNEDLRNNAADTMCDVFGFLNEEPVGNGEYGEVKYSNRSGIEQLEPATFRRMADFLYTDYRQYCEASGLTFTRLSYPEVTRNVA